MPQLIALIGQSESSSIAFCHLISVIWRLVLSRNFIVSQIMQPDIQYILV